MPLLVDLYRPVVHAYVYASKPTRPISNPPSPTQLVCRKVTWQP